MTLLLALMVPLAVMAQTTIYEMDFAGSPYGWSTYNTYGTGTVAVTNGKLVFTSETTGPVSGQAVASVFGDKMVDLTNDTQDRVVKVGFKLKPSVYTTTSNQRFAFQVGYFANNSSEFTERKTIYSNNELFKDDHNNLLEVSFSVIMEMPEGSRIAFQMLSQTTGKAWFLDDVYVQTVVPTGLAVTNITDSSADFGWDAISDISQWQVQYTRYLLIGNPWNDATTVTAIANPFPLTELNSNYTYMIRVAAKIGNNLSSYSDYVVFHTLRTPVTVDRQNPFTDDFADAVNWDFQGNARFQRWTVGTDTCHTNTQNPLDNRSMYVGCGNSSSYGYNCTNQRACTYAYKRFSLTETDYQISFWWTGQGYQQADYMRVFLVPDDTDLSTLSNLELPDGMSYSTQPQGWMPLDGGHGLNQQDEWVHYNATFELDNPGLYKVVFLWRNEARSDDYSPAAVDDFSLMYDYCDPPTIVNIANMEHSSNVSVVWENVPSIATTVSLQYKKTSESQWSEVITVAANETHYVLFNLEGNTDYEVRLTCDCSSSYSTQTFTSGCAYVTDYPLTYDFSEGIPGCLDIVSDHEVVGNYFGETCLYVIGNDGSITSPTLDLNLVNYGIKVSFNWYHNNHVDNVNCNDGVKVQYSTDYVNWTDASEVVRMYDATAGWSEKKFAVTALNRNVTGKRGWIRLQFVRDCGNRNFYIDDLSMDKIADCSPVDGFSKVFNGYSATLSWTAGEFQTEWKVARSTDATVDPGSTAFQTVTEPTITLDDVEWGTYVWIRSNCQAAGGSSDWTQFDLTEGYGPCADITGLTHSEIYNHNDITISWTPGAYQAEWEVVYSKDPSFNIDDVTDSQIHVVTEPQYTAHFVYEDTYRVWVRANCQLEGGYTDWQMISFMPTQYVDVTLNNGTNTNAMVPVNPSLTNADDMSMSQFILPQASVTSYEGKIKGLKFYANASSTADFTDAKFEVYMRETTQTAFGADEFADWSAMKSVYYGPLSVVMEGENAVMNIAFSNYFDYSGQGNLMIGIKQVVKGTDTTTPSLAWYGVETSGYASVGKNNTAEITRCQFLPKVQISNRAMDMPCPAPTLLRAVNVQHNAVTFGWVPGLEETSWVLGYRAGTSGDYTELPVTENPYTLTGLNSNTYYEITLKASCGGDEYSNQATTHVTTVMGNTFTTDGNWNVAANWSFNAVPAIDDEVYVSAVAVVPEGYVAEAKSVEILSGGSLTIADGGQMKCATPFRGKMQRFVAGYGETNDGYVLVASPVSTTIGAIEGFVSGNQFDNIDLYLFNQNNALWNNTKFSTDTHVDGVGDFPAGSIFLGTMFSETKAYLYANKYNTTLGFNATVSSLFPATTGAGTEVNLDFYSASPLAGWNLIGNPYTCDAYLSDNTPFYRMNDEGNLIELATDKAIKPCEGVFVQRGENTLTKVTFVTTEPSKGRGSLDLSLNKMATNRSGSSTLDRVRISFDEGQEVNRLDLMANPNRLYIPVDGKELSVACPAVMGEMPLNFDAAENGTFTIAVNIKDAEMSYLHLIDNLTGNDIDLLQTPSYTFDAKVSDYASRFKVVFAQGDGVQDGDFAFISNGNLVVNGTGTLQIVDMMGRTISSFSTSDHISTSNLAKGVYVLRLINGDQVKSQKIVVK